MGDNKFSVDFKRLAQLRAYSKKGERLRESGRALGDLRHPPPPRQVHPKTLGSSRSAPSLHGYNIGAGVPLFGGRFSAPSPAPAPPARAIACLPVHRRLAAPKTVVRPEEVSPFFTDSHSYEDAQFMRNLRSYRRGPHPGHFL